MCGVGLQQPGFSQRLRPPQQGGIVLPILGGPGRCQPLGQPQGQHQRVLPVPAGAVVQRQFPYLYCRHKFRHRLGKAEPPPAIVAGRPRSYAQVFAQLPIHRIVPAFVAWLRRVADFIMPPAGLFQGVIIGQIAVRRGIFIGAAGRHAAAGKGRSFFDFQQIGG